MNKLYINTMTNLSMNESTKEAMISKLISHRDKAVNAKQKKPFNWNKKLIGITASASAILIFCLVFFPIALFKQGGGQRKFQYDYYNEYKFELPFKHKITNTTDMLFFDATLSMEEMTTELNDAGYKASLYDFDNVKRIFITATKNDLAYYYAIYDKNRFESSAVYTLTNLTSSIANDTNLQSDKNIYVFLFPLHLSDTQTTPSNTKKIYCTFDEFANFYEATGKNDAQIDRANKTVTFFCKGSVDESWGNANWARGNVKMRYNTSPNGNYIDIQPQP